MPGRKKWASEEKAKIVMDTLTMNMTVRNDGGPHYTSARFLEALQSYKTINQEVPGKNRPD